MISGQGHMTYLILQESAVSCKKTIGIAKLSLRGGVHITRVASEWLYRNIRILTHPPTTLPLWGCEKCGYVVCGVGHVRMVPDES